MPNLNNSAAAENLTMVGSISSGDLMHFCGNWIWRAVEALLEAQDFNANPAWIADRLNISTEAAKDALEGLERIGMFKNKKHLYTSCGDLDRSDLFEVHKKVQSHIQGKLTSKSCFSNTILLTNKKHVTNFYQKFSEAVVQLNEESASDTTCDEVFALELSMVKITR